MLKSNGRRVFQNPQSAINKMNGHCYVEVTIVRNRRYSAAKPSACRGDLADRMRRLEIAYYTSKSPVWRRFFRSPYCILFKPMLSRVTGADEGAFFT